MKTPTLLRQKQQLKAKQEAELSAALMAQKAATRMAPSGPRKRAEATELAKYLNISLDASEAVRSVESFGNRCYQPAKQVYALIDHLFVRYPVPQCLYASMLTWAGWELLVGPVDPGSRKRSMVPPEVAYQQWFLAIGRGDSFAKLTKGKFTKREAHFFLNSPSDLTIAEAIFWAQCRAADVSIDASRFLVERLMPLLPSSPRAEVFRFYAENWHLMQGHVRGSITDFIAAMCFRFDFSFKGRTFTSMRNLAFEWHRERHRPQMGEFRSWGQLTEPWEWRKGVQVVRAIELATNRALFAESGVQRHCVWSYENACVQGRSRIVSFRFGGLVVGDGGEDDFFESARITIEIAPRSRSVVQIRGKLNRKATTEEMAVIRDWAGAHGFRIESFAN